MINEPRWMVAFDTETTGIDTENDRIIQAFVGSIDKYGRWLTKREWLIDPGIDIPKGASDVHGYTTERIRELGRKDRENCIQEIECEILRLTSDKIPLVAYNGSFDISILNAEMRRIGYKWEFFKDGASPNIFMLDPLICDKNLDPYRKGSRKQINVARHYGIEVDESKAHDAAYDCYLAGMLAWEIAEKWKRDLASLHLYQVEWASSQRESLEEYFRRTGRTEEDGSPIVINRGWPRYTRVEEN